MSALSRLKDRMIESEAAVSLKAKWDELDAKTRSALAWVGSALVLFLAVGSLLWATYATQKTRKELTEKNRLATLLETASQEMRTLREKNSSLRFSNDAGTNLSTYLISKAATYGVDQTRVSVSTPKPGTENDLSKETLYDIQLKKVSLKQILKLSHSLENGDRLVKLKNLQIENISDSKGYLDAKLSISTFVPVNSNEE